MCFFHDAEASASVSCVCVFLCGRLCPCRVSVQVLTVSERIATSGVLWGCSSCVGLEEDGWSGSGEKRRLKWSG